MFGSRDLTAADKAAVASIKRAKAAGNDADAARAKRQAIEAKRSK